MAVSSEGGSTMADHTRPCNMCFRSQHPSVQNALRDQLGPSRATVEAAFEELIVVGTRSPHTSSTLVLLKKKKLFLNVPGYLTSFTFEKCRSLCILYTNSHCMLE